MTYDELLDPHEVVNIMREAKRRAGVVPRGTPHSNDFVAEFMRAFERGDLDEALTRRKGGRTTTE